MRQCANARPHNRYVCSFVRVHACVRGLHARTSACTRRWCPCNMHACILLADGGGIAAPPWTTSYPPLRPFPFGQADVPAGGAYAAIHPSPCAIGSRRTCTGGCSTVGLRGPRLHAHTVCEWGGGWMHAAYTHACRSRAHLQARLACFGPARKDADDKTYAVDYWPPDRPLYVPLLRVKDARPRPGPFGACVRHKACAGGGGGGHASDQPPRNTAEMGLVRAERG